MIRFLKIFFSWGYWTGLLTLFLFLVISVHYRYDPKAIAFGMVAGILASTIGDLTDKTVVVWGHYKEKQNDS